MYPTTYLRHFISALHVCLCQYLKAHANVGVAIVLYKMQSVSFLVFVFHTLNFIENV
jgi:hypothetical protein